MGKQKIEVLFVYCQHRQDEDLQQALKEHMHELKLLDVDSQWYKYQDDPEENGNNEIYEHLSTANLIVPLISPAFLDKLDLIKIIEIAKKRCEEEDISVIPILLRQNTGWQRVMRDFTPLPSNGKAVNDKSWTNQDEAFVEIARGLVEKVEELIDYQKKLQEYEELLYTAIQQEEVLSDSTCGQLNNFKQKWGLKDKDTSLIEETVYRIKEEQEYQQKYWEWNYPFYASNQQDYSKFIGVTVAIFLFLFFLGGSLHNSQIRNSSDDISSSTSNETENGLVKSNSEGWIFIGRLNNPTNSNFGAALSSSSTSINPAIIPSLGSVLTVTKPVNLRKNRPQKPDFEPAKQKSLGIIKDGEKVVVLDAVVIRPKKFAVWAKVRTCDGECTP